jgi:FecR protein
MAAYEAFLQHSFPIHPGPRVFLGRALRCRVIFNSAVVGALVVETHDMIWRYCIFYIATVWFAAGFQGNPANAQSRVGEAVLVKNEVVRVDGAASRQINVGDGLLRDETVRTGVDSAARIVMADSTNLSLGPDATIKLDRTVFDDEHHYRNIAIRLASGALRFVTGHSDKTAYKLVTPVAAIGVRGTTLDILSQRGATTVVLQEGIAIACALSGQCVSLTQPGDTVVITSTNGKVTTQKFSIPPWSFAANCQAAPGLCTITQYADATPGVPAAVLCGR